MAIFFRGCTWGYILDWLFHIGLTLFRDKDGFLCSRMFTTVLFLHKILKSLNYFVHTRRYRVVQSSSVFTSFPVAVTKHSSKINYNIQGTVYHFYFREIKAAGTRSYLPSASRRQTVMNACSLSLFTQSRSQLRDRATQWSALQPQLTD